MIFPDKIATFTPKYARAQEMTENYHIPVLLKESIDLLDIQSGGTYVDLTFGGGGHSREILRRLGPDGALYSFDQDRDTLANAPEDERFHYVASNFRFMRGGLRYRGVESVDGVLADLGVSSHHFDAAERGFSFRGDGPLDMRMNQRGGRTAADVVNNYDAETLGRIFNVLGEVVDNGEAVNAERWDIHATGAPFLCADNSEQFTEGDDGCTGVGAPGVSGGPADVGGAAEFHRAVR